MDGDRFVFLDGLRGLAASAVVAMHAAIIFHIPLALPNVGLAVDFFFCLSGFVIALAYDAKISGSLTLRGFAYRRLARLYPMLFGGIVLGAIVAAMKQPGIALAPLLASSLVILPVAGAIAFPLNFPMWSLFFEAIANAAYGLDAGRLKSRTLAAVALIVGGLLIGLIAYAGQVGGFGLGGKTFALGVPRVLYPFILGVLIYRLSLWKLVRGPPSWAIAVVLAAALLVPFSGWIYQAAMVAAGMPLIVLFGAGSKVQNGGRVWSVLGAISYPLYVVHVPVLELFEKLTGSHSPYVAGLAATAAVIIAYAALTLFDQPVRRWLRPGYVTA